MTKKRSIKNYTGTDSARDQAIFWYFSGFLSHKFSKKDAKIISDEFAAITLRLPLHNKISEFNKKEINSSLKGLNLKKIYVDDDNYFYVKGIDKRMTPLHAVALYYCVSDIVLGGRLGDMSGFEWIKMAKHLYKEEVSIGK